MVNNTLVGIKKSDFTGATVVPDEGTLDFVYNGQNFKIRYADLVTALGAFGTITTSPDSGTPVLDKQGSVNVIRNIVGTSGISTVVNAQNGIDLAVDFNFDQTGEPLTADPDGTPILFKSLTAGPNVTLTSSVNDINIDASFQGVLPSNRVVVNDASDFPAAVGGVIQLADSTNYQIGNRSIVISDRLQMGLNTSISGLGEASLVTYTGTGTMITADGSGFSLLRCGFTCPNADFISASNTTSSINLDLISVTACQTYATLSNVFAFVVGTANGLSCTQGIVYTGTGSSIFSIDRFLLASTNASFIGADYGINVFTTLEFNDFLLVGPVGSVAFSGLPDSGNMAPNRFASIGSCEISAGMVPFAGGLTIDDVRYLYIANSGINDTNPGCLLSTSGNTTETVINTPGVPVKLVATWTPQISGFFDLTTDGRATFKGEREFAAPTTATISVEPVTGSNKELTAYLAVNGTIIPDSAITVQVNSGAPQNITVLWRGQLNNADYIEIFLANDSDLVNIIARSAVLNIR